MPFALLTLTWTSVAAQVFTLLSGLRLLPTDQPVTVHVLCALTGTLLALLGHTMTMFYFIGTGKKVKDFTADWDERTREDLRARIVQMKRKIFPAMTFVCVVLIVAFILGGAVHAKVAPRSFHVVGAYIALVYHVHVSVRESFYIFRNLELISEVNRMADAREASA